jgi:hypothetical protein
MKLHRITGLVAGLLSLGLLTAGPALAAGPANVHVRVEGDTHTLLPRTATTTTTTPAGKPGQGSCSGTSALGALDRATGGDWNGVFGTFGPQWQVTQIKGETHTASSGAQSGTYWAFWLDYRFSDAGLCDTELQEGDDVILFPDCFGDGCTSPTPLRVTGVPATARPGATATVKVVEYSAVFHPYPEPTGTAETPAAGATVTAGGQTVTTGADGTAAISFAGSGPQTVQATKPGHVRTAAEPVCVTTGSDGACGTTVPCITTGHDGLCGSPDTTAPATRLSRSTQDDWYYSRRHAPRTLRGTVAADPSGLKTVRLSLKRRQGSRCASYSASKERFLARACKRNAAWFSVGDRQDWSYLLPAALKPGKYTLRVRSIDNAGNHSPIRRGSSLVVFRVL